AGRPVPRLPRALAAGISQRQSRACADVAAGQGPDRPADRRPGGLLRLAPDAPARPARRQQLGRTTPVRQGRAKRNEGPPQAGLRGVCGRNANSPTTAGAAEAASLSMWRRITTEKLAASAAPTHTRAEEDQLAGLSRARRLAQRVLVLLQLRLERDIGRFAR